MSAAAIGIAVGSVALGAGLSYAMRPSYQQANLPASSRALSNTNAELLPIQRGMAAAAQTGGDFTFSLPSDINAHQYGFDTLPQGTDNAHTTQVFIPGSITQDQANGSHNMGPQEQLQQLFNNLTGVAPAGQWVNYDPADFQTGGRYASLGTPNLRTVTRNGGQYTVSFKGYGAGETQAKIAKQQAGNQLALAQKYDPQFIANALAQEKEADPQSFAARQRMSELIQHQIDNPIGTPTADILASQVGDQVKAGKGLDAFDSNVLGDAVSKSLAARGGGGQGADFSQPLTTGAAGVARQQAGIQKGIAELSSGSSPEDIAYRREQQNLANLSAETNGQTPQSQFRSLSGAQNGPTPNVAGQPLPLMPGNASQIGSQAALQASGIYNTAQQSQANPWLSGISLALSGAGAYGQAHP